MRLTAFLTALATLGASDRDAVYWAGRLTLCADPDDLERYDRVFAAYFDGVTATPGTGPPEVRLGRRRCPPPLRPAGGGRRRADPDRRDPQRVARGGAAPP
jgi:uncharacterized protein